MRYQPIQNTLFTDNRKRLGRHLESGSIALVCSNYQMPRNGDQYYLPYRQNSDLFYLTGIEQEKTLLLLAPDSVQAELHEVLFILRSTPKLEIWEGKKLTPDKASAISGIDHVCYLDEFDEVLAKLLDEFETIYVNTDFGTKNTSSIKSQDVVYAEQIQQQYPTHKMQTLVPVMQQLRLIKSEVEIDLIRKAIEITHETLLSVLQFIKPACHEYEIEALMGYEFVRRGAAGHAYAPIVANGSNACALHYIENNGSCNAGDLVLMDFGAEYANYAADLSRTIPVNGKYSPRQRELYNSVLRIVNYAKSLMAPGITINHLHDEVCKFVQEEHLKLGLYTTRDISEHKGTNPLWHNYYMHGTSHFLGLDVHDVGTKDISLQPGMVLTCEPAIYIAKEGIGIRTENNILITNAGHEDLMTGFPIEAEEIENIMQHTIDSL